jgi:hypothetical protein
MSTQEDTYSIINDRTGEIIPVDMFVERIPKMYWERSYARVLAEYIGVAGTATNKVLAWLIKNKDSNNRIIGTFAIIAKECGTTVPTVSTLFQKLYKRELLKKVHNGVYMLSPNLLRHGGQNKGAVLFKKWDDC